MQEINRTIYITNMNKKILIKLSGEALSNGGSDYNKVVLERIADQIKKLLSEDYQVALVLGGGNLFRGAELVEKIAVKRPTADYIGIAQNALVLRDYFEHMGISTRVSSAIGMAQVCEPYIPKRVERHLKKGRVVILAAGLGQPYFSSDSTCVQRALELGFDMVVMAKNGVDGVYTANPDTDPNATKIDTISASSVLEQGLAFADHAAVSLARENGLALKVIGMDDINRLGEKGLGTLVTAD